MILLGEMRDLETIGTALTAAETGHLVFATLHTQDAPSTVDRLIDVFPAAQQEQIRVQIASTLQGIVTQTLLPTRRRQGPRRRARDPAPRRRRPEPHPPGEGRADLLGHADQHGSAACRRSSRPCSSSSARDRHDRRRAPALEPARPAQDLLQRSGMAGRAAAARPAACGWPEPREPGEMARDRRSQARRLAAERRVRVA